MIINDGNCMVIFTLEISNVYIIIYQDKNDQIVLNIMENSYPHRMVFPIKVTKLYRY